MSKGEFDSPSQPSSPQYRDNWERIWGRLWGGEDERKGCPVDDEDQRAHQADGATA